MLTTIKEKATWLIVRRVAKAALAALVTALLAAGLVEPELLAELGAALVEAARPSGL